MMFLLLLLQEHVHKWSCIPEKEIEFACDKDDTWEQALAILITE